MTEKQIFDEIIATREHKSFISGVGLDEHLASILCYSCCAHIIPKKGHLQLDFPNKAARENLLRLNPDNIVLITPHEHFLIDQGTQYQRDAYEKEHNCSFSKFYEKKEELLLYIKGVLSCS